MPAGQAGIVTEKLAKLDEHIAGLKVELGTASLQGALNGPTSSEQARAYQLADQLRHAEEDRDLLVRALSTAEEQELARKTRLAAEDRASKNRAFSQHASRWQKAVVDLMDNAAKVQAAFDRALSAATAMEALTPWSHPARSTIIENISDDELRGLVAVEFEKLGRGSATGFWAWPSRIVEFERREDGFVPSLETVAAERATIIKSLFAGGSSIAPASEDGGTREPVAQGVDAVATPAIRTPSEVIDLRSVSAAEPHTEAEPSEGTETAADVEQAIPASPPAAAAGDLDVLRKRLAAELEASVAVGDTEPAEGAEAPDQPDVAVEAVSPIPAPAPAVSDTDTMEASRQRTAELSALANRASI